MSLERERQDKKAGKLETVHDIIMHLGYTARQINRPASFNPYSEENSKKKGKKYDPEKEKSWMMGWQDADRQSGMIIDEEKL